jgi:hypothetical protein
MSDAREDLAAFAARLGRTYDGAPTYGRLWQLMMTGDLPAERDGGRWRPLPKAEAVAVERFGLKPRRRQPTAAA